MSPRSRTRASLRAVIVLALAACGGDPASTPAPPSAATVASVVVTPADLRLAAGDSSRLSAEARDASGGALAGRAVVWTSRAPDVASVTADGTVRSVAAGTAEIEAKADGVAGVATVVVTLPAVASVSVTPAAAVMPVGGAFTLVTTARDAQGRAVAGRPVAFASSDTARLRVDAAGRVTAVSVGAATVTATVDGRAATAALEVVAGVASFLAANPYQGTLGVFAGQAPAIPPVIVARDAAGRPLAGVGVVFGVEGAGRLEQGARDTDAQGRAAPGLVVADTIVPNPSVGRPFTVRATIATPAATLPAVSYAYATFPGRAARLELAAGDAGTGRSGAVLPWRPVVRARDRYGNLAGLASDTVVFSVAAGGGALRDSVRPVGYNGPGAAVPGAWMLGATPGVNRLQATLRGTSGAPPVTITATGVTAVDTKFDVDVRFVGANVGPAVREAALVAVERWRQVVVGDLPDGTASLAAGFCGAGSPALSGEPVDDLILFVTVEPLSAGVAAVGGPCLLRATGSRLPMVARVSVNQTRADLMAREPDRVSDNAALLMHEIGHALGVGTLWVEASRGLAQGLGTADPVFTGTRATAAFAAAGGAACNCRAVPVTNDGHLRPPFLSNDIMTNVGNGIAAVTTVSAAVLADFGYEIEARYAQSLPVLAAAQGAARVADLFAPHDGAPHGADAWTPLGGPRVAAEPTARR